MAQLQWILDDIDAVDADFRQRYHWPPDHGPGIAEGQFPPAMSAARFFTLAELLPLQEGTVVRGLLEAENAERERQHDAGFGTTGTGPAATPRRDGPAGGDEEARTVPDAIAPTHVGFRGDGGAFPPVFNVRTSPRKP